MDFSSSRVPSPDLLLRERVYEYLKQSLTAGKLSPGNYLNLSSIEEDLGLSRTPLRDALLRLEAEGFVTIHSRRGVFVNALDPPTIRNIYQIIGALEGAAAEEAAASAEDGTFGNMEKRNAEMYTALERDSFDEYYAKNLEFHDSFVNLSGNPELVQSVHILKERLYDFPRRKEYLREWEFASVREHTEIVELFRSGDFSAAASYLRNIHWSFELQEHFVEEYYFSRLGKSGFGRP